MNKLIYISLLLSFIIFSACSSSEDAVKSNESEAEPEIYVFDDVSDAVPDTTKPVEEVTPQTNETTFQGPQYIVQVGAFTTLDRAESFVSEKVSQTDYSLKIEYSEDVKLYVIQIPPFTTREEAEKVRNEFWRTGLFEDAFIVTK